MANPAIDAQYDLVEIGHRFWMLRSGLARKRV
jgi:hypothetical protein